MEKEEILQYLKDNMSIKVNTRNSKVFGCSGKYISVEIKIGDITISSNEEYLR